MQNAILIDLSLILMGQMLIDKRIDLMSHTRIDQMLKELYTSETTLAQKIVLTTLNNEFIIKNRNSVSFMLKNPRIFLQKTKQKGHF